MKLKKVFCLLLSILLVGLSACSSSNNQNSNQSDNLSQSTNEEENVNTTTSEFPNGEVKVYNWGEYIDPEVITDFEKEYGIKVIYDMFETNEEMYPIIQFGSVEYDCICPSEYMIEKMINENLLKELDFTKMPNAQSKIGEKYWNIIDQVDEGRKHSVPYMAGSVGILYNKTLLDEKGLPYPEHWSDLWKEEYKDEILMQNSVRDAFMVALKKNGLSANTLNEDDIKLATDDLISQKPLVQAYVVDQVRDKMINGEALIGVIYSGEVKYVSNEAEGTYEYGYVLPEEGTNIWVDAWCIPHNSQNVENAHKWINYMCDVNVAVKNAEFLTYESPVEEAHPLISEDCKLDENMSLNDNPKNEVYGDLGEEGTNLYNEYWKKIKS